jgi:hypothetical protein
VQLQDLGPVDQALAVKVTMSGCLPHHAVSASVHSEARRNSEISWQIPIIPQ